MNWSWFFLALFSLNIAQADVSGPEGIDQLSNDDRVIYQSTFQKCSPGTVTSALKLGYDLSNFASSVENWFSIASLNFDASAARANAHGLSPRVRQLRKSPGFWLAMSHCYGYFYGEANYGNLMKQIIDFGHLVTEVSSTVAGVGAAVGSVMLFGEFAKVYPLAARFVASSLISIQVASGVEQIRKLTSTQLTPEERKQFEEAQRQIFAKPNEAIRESIEKSQLVIARIDERLRDPDLSQDKRQRLLQHRAALVATLDKLPSNP